MSDETPSWSGGALSPRAVCVLAPNPGPMTLDGTNTWVLGEPDSPQHVVVDPGPLDEGHLQRVLDLVDERGGHVAMTLLTHGHRDHAESAQRFRELTGAPVLAAGRGHDDLVAGDVLTVGGLEVAVVATPGHTADSVCFLVPAESLLLTGDTVLGRGTTVVAWPDGDLGAYLESLEDLDRLAGSGALTRILPGHGPVLDDPAAVVRFYREHRRERLDQVRAALADGAAGVDGVLRAVYSDVPRDVWPAARMSIRAQLAYLGVPREPDSG